MPGVEVRVTTTERLGFANTYLVQKIYSEGAQYYASLFFLFIYCRFACRRCGIYPTEYSVSLFLQLHTASLYYLRVSLRRPAFGFPRFMLYSLPHAG